MHRRVASTELRRIFSRQKSDRSLRHQSSKGSGGSGEIPEYSEESALLHTNAGHSNISDKVSELHSPRKKVGDLESIKNMICESYLHVLLICMPIATWAYYAQWGDTAVFVLNFLAMMPLANILGGSTESLAFHTGETIGGLINASFGNVVEIIIAIFALRNGEITVVQSSLLGSILSNLLLVLGCSFLAGGYKNKESQFNGVGATANSSLLMLASFAMLVPSYYQYTHFSPQSATTDSIISLSHISACFLLFMYGQLLYFQLYTHIHLFVGSNDDEEEEVDLSLRASVAVLLVATILVAIFSEFLVSSIDGFTETLNVSKSFVGIILLPIVGNAVEHVTAVKVAFNGKMELAMGVAVGSATQIALFVVPVTVIAGWIMGQPMTLAFPTFEAMTYVMSIVIVYAIIADGKSNWLEGSMLLTTYGLIAVALLWIHVG